ncbi:MAG: glycosyltransferase family 4 protein [Ferruginibacter sp.]
MPARIKITFISHDASLSGAPILLINLVKLLSTSGQYKICIIVKRGGPLNERFSQAAKTIVLKPAGYRQSGSWLVGIKELFSSRLQLIRALWNCHRSEVVFSNTITNGRLLKKVARVNRNIISYIHELEEAARVFEEEHDSSLTIRLSRLLLYPSTAVAAFLKSYYHVPEDKLKALPYYFPPMNSGSSSKAAERQWVASVCKLPVTNRVVLAMGSISHRKGIDLFMETARIVCTQRNDISFVWTGPYENAAMEKYVQDWLQQHPGLAVGFTGPRPPAIQNFLCADLFFLSSREDPYPLVVLEAAYTGLPAICFSASGGITDFVNDTNGWLINGFSAGEAASCIMVAIDQPATIITKGERARQDVLDLHFNENRIRSSFNQILSARAH